MDGHRAIVIDADERIRQATRQALEARGIPTLVAPCGLTGLGLLLERLFEVSVVVSDLEAPNLDGWSLVRVIRQLGNEQDIHLVITGEAVAAAAARLAAMGVDAVLDRAVGTEAIAARAAQLLAGGPRSARTPWPALPALPALASAHRRS
jgi:CheY-like chemotaxis protein